MTTKKTKKVVRKDISEVSNAELGQFVFANHGRFFDGKPTSFLVSTILASVYYNQEKGYAFPSEATLAEKIGVSERQVKRYIADISNAVDEAGEPLWTVRQAKENGGFGRGNHYIPNFVHRAANSELNEQIREYYAGNTIENASEETEVASRGTMEPQADYTFVPLPASYAKDPEGMFEFMIPFGTKRFAEPAKFDSLDAMQQDFLSIMVSYLAVSGNINETEVDETAQLIANTWAAHPETPRDIFYNRFMNHLASSSA